jgi:hypothetical protein
MRRSRAAVVSVPGFVSPTADSSLKLVLVAETPPSDRSSRATGTAGIAGNNASRAITLNLNRRIRFIFTGRPRLKHW